MKTTNCEVKLIALLSEAIDVIRNNDGEEDAYYIGQEMEKIIQTITLKKMKNDDYKEQNKG